MRWFPLCLCLAGVPLAAQVALHIVAVERRGPPPYEEADRVYVLDGGQDQGLHLGGRLLVKRADTSALLGHLKVVECRPDQAQALFEPLESTYPLKGDLALLSQVGRLPLAPLLDPAPLPLLPRPRAGAEPPPKEGLLFFLPGRAELSLGGVRKLEAWVAAWGGAGRWSVQVPASKGSRPEIQKQRAESVQAALRALGIPTVALESGARTAEGPNDPAWVRHWD